MKCSPVPASVLGHNLAVGVTQCYTRADLPCRELCDVLCTNAAK